MAEGSSTGSSAGSNHLFVVDPGPEFDPEHAPAAPAIEREQTIRELIEEGWEEPTVRELLKTQGKITNWALRLTEDDDTWKQTEDDLETIAPPLTRILNRYDATRAAAAFGDEALLVAGVSNYTVRNYTRRRRLLARLRAAAQAEQDRVAQPIPAPAPEGELFETEYPPTNLRGGPHVR